MLTRQVIRHQGHCPDVWRMHTGRIRSRGRAAAGHRPGTPDLRPMQVSGKDILTSNLALSACNCSASYIQLENL